MAATTIANLWVPQIWIRGADEKMRTLPSLLTSGSVVQDPRLDAAASGAGTSVTLPFLKDISDDDEVIQVEATGITVNNMASGQNIAPVLNREKGYGVNALANAVSGDDVVGSVVSQLGVSRQKRTLKAALSILRGLYNVAGAPAAAAQLSATRYDAFSETGASPGPTLLIDAAKFNAAVALMGEMAASLRGGALWMHPNIRAALQTQDAGSFEHLSQGQFILETYKGIPVYQNVALVRAGGTSGFVYDTYLIGPRAIGWGEKPQVGDEIDVASLQFDMKKDVNQSNVYDRRRYLVHVDGTKWTGTPAGQSATNAELATSTNWSLQYQTADRIPLVCIRTNG